MDLFDSVYLETEVYKEIMQMMNSREKVVDTVQRIGQDKEKLYRLSYLANKVLVIGKNNGIYNERKETIMQRIFSREQVVYHQMLWLMKPRMTVLDNLKALKKKTNMQAFQMKLTDLANQAAIDHDNIKIFNETFESLMDKMNKTANTTKEIQNESLQANFSATKDLARLDTNNSKADEAGPSSETRSSRKRPLSQTRPRTNKKARNSPVLEEFEATTTKTMTNMTNKMMNPTQVEMMNDTLDDIMTVWRCGGAGPG